MELLLIRHGLPLRIENSNGEPADPPLSDEGCRQAERLAAWLRDESLDAVYSSPMRRARQTAEPLAEGRSLDIIFEPDIAEFDAESESYVPLEELKATDYARWKEFVDGGYQQPQEFAGFCQRVAGAIESIVAGHRGDRVALVCHGGVVNVWAALVMGFQPRLFIDVNYTSINRFMVASSGERSVISLNEAAHLRP